MGALTLKVFSNELREWELIEAEAIDPTNSFGVNLRLSLRENQIYLSEPNDPETPWITDKARLFFDGMFSENDNKKNSSMWESFFRNFCEQLYFVDYLNFQKKTIFSLVFIFENLSLEVLNILYFLEQSNSLIKIRKSEIYNINNDLEINYQLNNSLENSCLTKSSLALLLNTNSRYEGYVLNLNLRHRIFKGDFKLLSIGSKLDLTFPTVDLGSNMNTVKLIAEGTHFTCQNFKNASSPLLITNTEFFKRDDSEIFFNVLQKANIFKTINNNLNILSHNLGHVGTNSLTKFLPLSSEDLKNFFSFYFINVSLKASSNIKHCIQLCLLKLLSRNNLGYNNYNKIFVDQSSSVNNIDFLNNFKGKIFDNYYYLPSSLFLEDSETFINTEGMIKRTTKLISFQKNAKSNWQIIRKIYLKTKFSMFFNQKKDSNIVNFDATNLNNIKNYLMFQFYAVQTFTNFSYYLTKQNSPYFKSKLKFDIKKTKTKIYFTKLKNWLDDFFTENGKDSFSYNSAVLMNCSKILRISSTNFF